LILHYKEFTLDSSRKQKRENPLFITLLLTDDGHIWKMLILPS